MNVLLFCCSGVCCWFCSLCCFLCYFVVVFVVVFVVLFVVRFVVLAFNLFSLHSFFSSFLFLASLLPLLSQVRALMKSQARHLRIAMQSSKELEQAWKRVQLDMMNQSLPTENSSSSSSSSNNDDGYGHIINLGDGDMLAGKKLTLNLSVCITVYCTDVPRCLSPSLCSLARIKIVQSKLEVLRGPIETRTFAGETQQQQQQ